MPKLFEVSAPNALITDINPYGMDTGAWTVAEDVAFNSNGVEKMGGYIQVYGTPSGAPYYLLGFTQSDTKYWFYPTLTKIYRTDGSTHLDVTRTVGGDYTGTVSDRWNGCVLGGVAILNNGVDDPQFYDQSSSDFEDLTNWPASTKARVIRSFKNYLFALYPTESGVSKPTKIRWSDAAEPGSVPSSWLPETSNDAGSVTLSETDGHLIDGVPLGDIFVVYKSDSIYGFKWRGGNFVFDSYLMFDGVGLLALDCAKEYPGGHFFVGRGDVYIHNGRSYRSVIEDRVKEQLFSDIDPNNKDRVFVTHKPKDTELWVCYPDASATSGLCNRAAKYNYTTDSWCFADLPDVSFIATGETDLADAGSSWGDTTSTWGDTDRPWSESNFNPIKDKILYAGTGDTKIYSSSELVTRDGSAFTSNLEKVGMDFGNPSLVKYIYKVYPIVTGTGSLNITVGYEDNIGEGVNWASSQTFTIGTDRFINTRTSGRYIAIKFDDSNSNTSFDLKGYIIEYKEMNRGR